MWVLTLLLGVLVVLAITAATAYFVAQEFGYMSVDRSRLAARAEAGDVGARVMAAVPPVRRRLVVRQRTAATLTVGTGTPAVLAHDGETTPLPAGTVAQLRLLPGALRVYAAHRPHTHAHDRRAHP